MAVPNNYIDKINKDGDSRMISPAADMVRVDNDNFEGTDLDEVLDEVAQAIGEAGEGGYAPPAGGIPKTDLASDVQNSLGKADTALQSFTETDPTVPSWAKQQTKPTYTAQEVGALPADTTIPTKTSDLNNDSGFVTEAVQSVSVDTNGDGTVDINVDDDTYTINLNHTHENMAKLVVCDESELPATLDTDTIYAQVDDAENPTEIETLYIAGLEFTGGGGGTGEPRITTPANGSTINLGNNDGSGVSETITVKGRYLTSDLTVAVGGSDMSLTYGQTTAASVTIPLADALAGARLTIAYSGADGFDDRTLVITHGNDVLSTSTLVVTDTWTTVDLSLNTVDAWIGSNGTFSSGDQLSTLIPPSGATQVKIKANDTRACYFLFLKSVPTFPTSSAYGPYLCTGETGRRSVAIGTTDTVNIPSGCVQIMVGLQSAAATPLGYQPTFVKLK